MPIYQDLFISIFPWSNMLSHVPCNESDICKSVTADIMHASYYMRVQCAW